MLGGFGGPGAGLSGGAPQRMAVGGPRPGGGGIGGGGMQTFKHGGKVKKTGLAHVEKNERVLTKKQQKHDLKDGAKKRMR